MSLKDVPLWYIPSTINIACIGHLLNYMLQTQYSLFSGDLHEDEELVYREEWDTGGFEAASVEDDRFLNAQSHGHDCIDSTGPSAASDAVWKTRGAFLSIFSDMWVMGKRLLHPTDQHHQIVSQKIM